MGSFFTEGGVGMYPTLVFGFLMIASAALYALRGERRYFSLMLSLGATTLAAGALGFCMGVVYSFRYLPEVAADKQVMVAALGVSESLHDLLLALGLVIFTGLIAAVGALRAPAAKQLAGEAA
jgi:hypothetical protein